MKINTPYSYNRNNHMRIPYHLTKNLVSFGRATVATVSIFISVSAANAQAPDLLLREMSQSDVRECYYWAVDIGAVILASQKIGIDPSQEVTDKISPLALFGLMPAVVLEMHAKANGQPVYDDLTKNWFDEQQEALELKSSIIESMLLSVSNKKDRLSTMLEDAFDASMQCRLYEHIVKEAGNKL